ncbi:CARDB domain-containing protein [Fodinicola acaciae]|uniref:CARDB domain-containing protein n=1 Tax=Fodinicola acaciae TaxID=2681555 RepID=UPI0013D0635E|nr:CARDB domain-containing protein [Fodinicola acaciae]
MSGAASLVLALAVAPTTPALAVARPGAPAHQSGNPSFDTRLGYAGGGVEQLAAGTAATRVLPSTDTTITRDTDAFARGAAVTWVTKTATGGGVKADGDIAYWSGGVAPMVRLTSDAYDDRHPVLNPAGTQIAFASNRSGNWDIWTIGVDGTGLHQVTTSRAVDDYPSYSPDGTQLAFSSTRDDPSGDIYTVTIADGTVKRLTTTAGVDTEPAWSPSGTKVAFATDRYRRGDRLADVVTITLSNNAITRLTTPTTDGDEPAWSPDGTKLAITSRTADLSGDIYTINPTAGSARTAVAVTTKPESRPSWWTFNGTTSVIYSTFVAKDRGDIWTAGWTDHPDQADYDRTDVTNTINADEADPEFSPDGSKVAYADWDNTNNRSHIVVANADGSNPQDLTPLVSGRQDTQPTWSPDGTLVAFTRGGTPAGTGFVTNHPQQIVIVDAATGAARTGIGDPSSGRPRTALWDSSPSWSADGTRIAFGRVGATSATATPDYYRIWLADLSIGDGTVEVDNQSRLLGTADNHGTCTVSGATTADSSPSFQRDGGTNYIAFAIGGGRGICRTDADGTNPLKIPTPTSAGTISDLAWAPGGNTLAFTFTPAPPPVIRSAPAPKTTPKTTPSPKTSPTPTPSPSRNTGVSLGQPASTADSAYTAVPALHSGGVTANLSTAQIYTVFAAGDGAPGYLTKSVDVPGGAVSPTWQRTNGNPQVTVTAGPQPATVGNDLTVTYAVKNNGTTPVKQVWTKITAPAGLQVKSVTPAQCASNGSDCFVPTLAAGATFTATITYTITAPLNSAVSATAQMQYPDGAASSSDSATVLAVSGGLNYRIAYASNDTTQVLHAAPDVSPQPALPNAEGKFGSDASGHGTAIAWVSRDAAVGSAETDGELMYAANANATPVRLTNDLNNLRHPAISPDGTQIAFADDRSGSFNIWVINVDGTGIRRITTSPGIDDYPTWSPDGLTIAFASNRSTSGNFNIYSTPAAGGATTQLTGTTAANTATVNTQPAWSPDGTRIAYATNLFRGTTAAGLTDVAVILANGTGSPVRLTSAMDSSEPAWSPDSLSIAYTTTRFDGAGDIYTQALGGSAPQAVAASNAPESHPSWWTPSAGAAADVLYTSITNLGNGGDIWSSELTGGGRYDHSDRPVRDEAEPAFSLDGSRLAYVEYDERGDSRIAVSDFDGRNNRSIADFGDAMTSDSSPAWAPNGQVLAFTRSQYEAGDEGRTLVDSWIVIVRVDATGVTTLLDRVPLPEGLSAQDSQPAFSPANGSQLAFTRATYDDEGRQQRTIWRVTVTVAGNTATVGDQTELTATTLGNCQGGSSSAPYDHYSPAWSPDGRSIAYVSYRNLGEGYSQQLCVVNTADLSFRSVISNVNNYNGYLDNPAWSPDGRYLAYDFTEYSSTTYSAMAAAAADVSPYASIYLVDAAGGPGAKALSTPGGAQQPAFQTRFTPPTSARPPLNPNDATNQPFSLQIAPQPGVVGGSPLVATYTIRNLSDTAKTAAVLTTGLPAALPVTGKPVIGGATDPTADCSADGTTCHLGIITKNTVITVKATIDPRVKIATTVNAKLDYVDASGAKQTLPASSPLVVGEPTIALLPSVGPPGLVPTARGAGFPPNTKVTLDWQFGLGQKPLEVTTDGKGNFTVPIVVPYHDIKNKRLAGVRLTGTGPGFKPVTSLQYQVGGVPDFPGPNQ